MHDKIRISLGKSVFEKGFDGNLSREIFTVIKVHPCKLATTDKLIEHSGSLIKGKFYDSQLVLVHV